MKKKRERYREAAAHVDPEEGEAVTRKEGSEERKWRCEDKPRLGAKFAQIVAFLKAKTWFYFFFFPSPPHAGGHFLLFDSVS